MNGSLPKCLHKGGCPRAREAYKDLDGEVRIWRHPPTNKKDKGELIFITREPLKFHRLCSYHRMTAESSIMPIYGRETGTEWGVGRKPRKSRDWV